MAEREQVLKKLGQYREGNDRASFAFKDLVVVSANVTSRSSGRKLVEEVDEEDRLHDLLKYGLSVHHWNGFVFQAYHHHQYGAIFLAGLPDVKGSLPHA